MWTRGGIQRFGDDGGCTYHFVLQGGDGSNERPRPVTIRPPTGSAFVCRGYDVGQGCFLFVDLQSRKSPKDMLKLRLWIQRVVVRVAFQQSRYFGNNRWAGTKLRDEIFLALGLAFAYPTHHLNSQLEHCFWRNRANHCCLVDSIPFISLCAGGSVTDKSPPGRKNGDSFPDGEKAPVFFSAEELFLPCEEKVRLFFPCGVIGNWLLIFFPTSPVQQRFLMMGNRYERLTIWSFLSEHIKTASETPRYLQILVVFDHFPLEIANGQTFIRFLMLF